MIIKEWTYEEFPAFDAASVEGAGQIKTSGDEVGVRYIPNVTYACMEDIRLRLQILRPFSRNEPDKILPCVVYVQGSAWMEQDVYFALPMLSDLARRGYVVAVAEYRHSGIAPFPAQCIDARNAVRYLRSHASQYGIDPGKMVLAGDSSGGHTALFAVIRRDEDARENLYPNTDCSVSAVIDFYGACGFLAEDSNPSTLNYKLPDSPEGRLLGGRNLRTHPELVREITVQCQISADTPFPPLLIFHGTKDRTVNASVSADLYRAMKKAGKDVSLYFLEGADHGGAEFFSPAVLDLIDAFIRRCTGE